MRAGNYVQVRGQGHAGRRGGERGDIFAVIEEKAHTYFQRDGDNIIYDLKIGLVDAVLGSEVFVPTLSGKAALKLEPGTQNGRILRMKHKGIPNLDGYGRGDQLVRVTIWIPTKLASGERKLFEELHPSKNLHPKTDHSGFFDRDL